MFKWPTLYNLVYHFEYTLKIWIYHWNPDFERLFQLKMRIPVISDPTLRVSIWVQLKFVKIFLKKVHIFFNFYILMSILGNILKSIYFCNLFYFNRFSYKTAYGNIIIAPQNLYVIMLFIQKLSKIQLCNF